MPTPRKPSRAAIPCNPFRFIRYVSRDLRVVAVSAIAFVLLATALGSAAQYTIKLLIDATQQTLADPHASYSRIWLWGLMYPAVVFVRNWCWRGSGFCGMRWLTGAESNTYRVLFAHLTGHSASFFQSRFAGALSNKISNAASGVLQLLATSLWQFLPLLAGFVTNAVIAYLAHPLIAAIFIGWVIVLVGINALLMGRLSRLSIATAEASSDLKGKIVDTSTNISAVQQFAQVLYEQSFVSGFIDGYRRKHLKSWRAGEWVLVLNNVLVISFIVSIVGSALYLMQRQQITVGTVAMIIALVGGMEFSLTFISMIGNQAIRFHGQIREGLDELLLPHEIVDHPNAVPLASGAGAIDFRSVSFSYGAKPVFTGFSLAIPAGQKLGLVGPSGAGKSTFVSLLLRQYEVTQGAIAIDGQDIRRVTQESLRRAVALVPQDVSLFHRTIADNIRYGRLDAADDEVREAAKLAQADQFIRELPDGYATHVGERGVRLSGGQRQRVAIARAFLKNAPILVLDEATSSLDSESEGEIQLALARLFQGRTVIAIAHRLSTLKAMDRLIILDNGWVVEDGPHHELLARGGLYAQLWSRQVEGFIGGGDRETQEALPDAVGGER